jgi:hypothetical protein
MTAYASLWATPPQLMHRLSTGDAVQLEKSRRKSSQAAVMVARFHWFHAGRLEASYHDPEWFAKQRRDSSSGCGTRRACVILHLAEPLNHDKDPPSAVPNIVASRFSWSKRRQLTSE